MGVGEPGLLADHPMTGYDLTRSFDRSLANVWPVSHSQYARSL